MKIYVDTPFKDEYKKLLLTSAPDDTFIFKEDLAGNKARKICYSRQIFYWEIPSRLN
jgi:hypothetical protein